MLFIDVSAQSQQQIADLFQTSRENVRLYLKHIFEEGELAPNATCRDFRQVRPVGARQVARTMPLYNLDRIISLGYRVRGVLAIRFCIWVAKRLREYLVKGFASDDEKLQKLTAFFERFSGLGGKTPGDLPK